eukprot:9106032-Alexandrium_andersonii.AAC.1
MKSLAKHLFEQDMLHTTADQTTMTTLTNAINKAAEMGFYIQCLHEKDLLDAATSVAKREGEVERDNEEGK